MKKLFTTMALGVAMYAMPAQAIDINIAATGQTSSYYAYHAAVAKVIKDTYPDINITVMATGGSVENMRLIERGQADWGQFVEPTFYEDYAAIGSAKGQKPKSDLRFMWAIAEISLYNIVNADSEVKSISDLSGKKYGAGSSGSLTEKITADLIKVVGATPELTRGGYGDLSAAMKDRRITGFTKSGSLTSQDATVMDVRTAVPIRVVGFTAEEKAKVMKAYPHYSLPEMKKTPYGDGPVTLYRTALISGGSSAVSDDVAYRSFKAVAENMDKIAQTFSAVKGIDLIKSTLAIAKTPLHPGVIKYIEEKGHKVPDALRPPKS